MKRVSAKDVLKEALRWKKSVDQATSDAAAKGNVSVLYPYSLEFYKIVSQFETDAATEKIEKEVFDDVDG